jgi:hypothetical protein
MFTHQDQTRHPEDGPPWWLWAGDVAAMIVCLLFCLAAWFTVDMLTYKPDSGQQILHVHRTTNGITITTEKN